MFYVINGSYLCCVISIQTWFGFMTIYCVEELIVVAFLNEKETNINWKKKQILHLLVVF